MSCSFSGSLSYFYFTLFIFCILCSVLLLKYDDDDDKFIVRLIYDSDSKRAKIFLQNVVNYF